LDDEHAKAMDATVVAVPEIEFEAQPQASA